MALPITKDPIPTVLVESDRVMVHDLIETDPATVAVVADADDPVAATRRLLQVGARAVQAAGTSLDTAIVERSFETLTHKFDDIVSEASQQVSAAGEALFHPDHGDLVNTLTGWRDEVIALLGDTFDPTRRNSVLGKFEELFTRLGEQHQQRLRRLFDTADPDNPIGRLRGEVVDALGAQRRELTTAFSELAQQVAVDRKEAELLELTTAKGFRYEDLVHETLAPLAAAYGDLAEQVGTVAGAAGSKAGDEVISLNTEDTGGRAACITFEIKDRKLGVRKTYEELDAAITNRAAAAGIAVFSSQRCAPSRVPFQYHANRAIVVFDKDDPDPAALRLAYLWGRWVAKRDCREGSGGVDVEHISSLVDDARRQLELSRAIKTAHGKARRGLDDAARNLDELVATINETLDALDSELAANGA